MKEISKEQALDLITKNQRVFNINTGLWYYYNYGTSTVPIFPTWVTSLPENGWRTY